MNAQGKPKEQRLVGMVIRLTGNQIIFRTQAALVYAAVLEAGGQLLRKNGMAMEFADIIPGDKLEVRGLVWPDGVVHARVVRNLSLYVRTSSLTGPVVSVSVTAALFDMESPLYGRSQVVTTPSTSFSKSGGSAVLQDLKVGWRVRVRGQWERTRERVTALAVRITSRLINITITGELVLKSSTALTVVSQGVIYGADVTTAKFFNKANKPTTLQALPVGAQARVRGKHLPESVAITAVEVKLLS